MDGNMARSSKTIYRIDQGGLSRVVRGRVARERIARELHGQVVALGEVKGRVPEAHADWFYDLRRKQNRVYGGLLRFIDDSAQLGTPREVLHTIPSLIAAYIEDVYEDRNPKRAA